MLRSASECECVCVYVYVYARVYMWVGVSDSTKVIPKASPGGTPQIKSRKLSLNLRAPHLTNTHGQRMKLFVTAEESNTWMGELEEEEMTGLEVVGGGCLYAGWKYANQPWGPVQNQTIKATRFIVAHLIWRSAELNKQMAAASPSSWLDLREASVMLSTIIQFQPNYWWRTQYNGLREESGQLGFWQIFCMSFIKQSVFKCCSFHSFLYSGFLSYIITSLHHQGKLDTMAW